MMTMMTKNVGGSTPKRLLSLSRYGVASSGLLEDYTLRSNVGHFEKLCVWDYVSLVEKATISSMKKGRERERVGEPPDHQNGRGGVIRSPSLHL